MSTLKLDTISSRDGTESTDVTNVINGSAKAWVNYDQYTGGTITIRASFNVSSMVDVSAGKATINFTNAMEDSNYCCASMAGHAAVDGAARYLEYDQDDSKTASSITVRTVYDWFSIYDCAEVYFLAFR
jgi:hypothetical protein